MTSASARYFIRLMKSFLGTAGAPIITLFAPKDFVTPAFARTIESSPIVVWSFKPACPAITTLSPIMQLPAIPT